MTPCIQGCYSLCMATQTNTPPTAPRRTRVAGFRVFRDQYDFLTANYKDNQSALIRFLLDDYIDGKIQGVSDKMKKLIELKRSA